MTKNTHRYDHYIKKTSDFKFSNQKILDISEKIILRGSLRGTLQKIVYLNLVLYYILNSAAFLSYEISPETFFSKFQ